MSSGLPGGLRYAGIWLRVIGITSLPDDLPLLAWAGLILVTIPGAIRPAPGVLPDRLHPGNLQRWL